MSKTDLCVVAGLSANSLSAYENAKTTPLPETVERLAEATRHAVSFFYAGEAPLVDAGAVSFRALSRVPAPQRDRVTGAIGHAIELDRWITERFERPVPSIPDLSGSGPVAAAEAMRSEWGLGAEPITNLIHLVELMGVRVYSLGAEVDIEDLGSIDALSTWWGGVPFVLLKMCTTAERVRQSLAHEIAHLLLHQDGGPTGQRAEKEAKTFAGHLLLPSAGLRAEAKRFFSFDEIVEAKRRWGISALAYVYRMNEEHLLDDWRYKELCIKLRRDYGALEPEPAQNAESSQVLRKVFSQLQADGGRAGVAGDLGISVSDLDSLIFSHTLTPVTGGTPQYSSDGGPNHLKVLK